MRIRCCNDMCKEAVCTGVTCPVTICIICPGPVSFVLMKKVSCHLNGALMLQKLGEFEESIESCNQVSFSPAPPAMPPGHCLASMIDHCLAFSEALALDEGNAKALFRRGTGEKATSTHAAVGPVHGQPGPKTIV